MFMNKFLRYSLSLAFAFVASVSFAQTYLWQEDFSSYKANEVPTGGDNSYVCVDGGSTTKVYNEKLAGGTAPELLVGKSTGSFSATIKLNGKSGDMHIAYKANRNDLKVTVENGTLGDKTASGNDYTYPVSVAAGTESITIKFTCGSKNTRLDDIKLYQGDAKKPAGLSWGTASRSVTIGAEDNSFPTLTNANDLKVTYSSSNTDVATISEDGTITLIAAGTTDIKAAFAGNDEYEAGEVTYTLTVVAASTVDITNTPESAYTVAKALELIEAGEGLSEKVYVKGKISKVKSVDTGKYGNAEYSISDDGTDNNSLIVYRGYYVNGEKFTSADQIKVGDEVIVYGKLVNYNGTKEFTSGNQIYSINGITTGLSGITLDAAAENAPAFNLAGQQVSKAYKGVVIKAGKKFVQK